ncbi:MFS transporter [Leifsonia sp. LS1]|uniref:MFS transporter n=1 Tax=Leifsonia sp. LS1 TaxID=2828483 RepID=UPI001CFC7091|nr:MFS transporter [Leifsonia sp. LS1]GIT80601.1 MFS transporter [Leifsonia sp. LS1]
MTRCALAPLMVAQALGAAAAGASVTVSAMTASRLSGAAWSAGFAQSATVVGAAALSMPIAQLAARHGRRTALIVAYAVATVGGLAAAIGVMIGSLALFFAALAALGGGTVAGLALRFAAAELQTDTTRRPGSIALVLWMAAVGGLVGPNIASMLDTQWGRAAPFVMIAATYTANIAVVSTLRRPPHAMAPDPRSRPIEPESAAPPIALVNASITAVAGHMAMTGLMGLAPPFLASAGASGAMIGAVMSAHLVAMYAASPLIGVVVRRLTAQHSCAVALMVDAGACALIVVGTGSTTTFAIGLTLLGLGWSFGMIASSAILASAPPPKRLRAQGRLDTLINVGGATASALTGISVSAAGYPTVAAWVGACVAVLAVGMALRGTIRRQLSQRFVESSIEDRADS